MKGKFFAVGVGPGDPELLTLKAIRVIKEADYVAVPMSGAKENVASKITEEYLKGKDIIEIDMPMVKDKKIMEESHEMAAERLSKLLDKGHDIAFITLGDPSIYSTAMYVHRKIKERGYETMMVSGVPSFVAAAASLDVSLCEGKEMLHIVPATFKGTMPELEGVRVLMKSGKSIMKLRDELIKEDAMMVECATMENEKVYHHIGDLKEESSYFSLTITPGRK